MSILNKNGNKTKKRPRLSMRSRVFITFAAFSIAVLAVLWVSQTVFMDDLYKNVRLREIRKCADGLADAESDGYLDAAEKLSEKYNICISVFEISRGKGYELAKAHIDAGCFIHNVISESFQTDSMFTRLYNNAKESGADGYMENASLHRNDAADGIDEEVGNILYSVVLQNGGREYLLVLNTEIYPLASTVSTMRMMLVYISIITIGIGAVLSALLANHLSRSAVKMSREAGKLALGNYGVHFDGGSCKEMCELADTLNHAAFELAGLDRMQKDLIANVSHDLRTPLTLIAGYSEVMRDIPGEMTAENMQVVIDEANRLAYLVNDMLDMSRFISGKQSLNISTFSLTDAVRETVDRYAKLREREGYVIDFEYDTEIAVEADRTRILQVIYNLVNNAINYTGEDKRVVIRQTVSDGYCKIEVSDSGCGIPEAELPLIWERYYKSNEFHKRSQMGTGLGLSIVKNILALHKAKFGVRSKVGKGSTFWFELSVAFDENLV